MNTDRERGFYHVVIRMVLLGAAFGSVMALFSRHFWFAELFSHFRLYYLLALVLLALTFLWTGHRYLLLLSILLALPNAWYVGPYLSPLMTRMQAAQATSAKLTLVAHNLKYTNQSIAPVLNYLREIDADVLVLAEFTEDWRTALAPLEEIYPYHVFEPRRNQWGLAVYSRIPFESVETLQFSDIDDVQVRATLLLGGEAVELFAVHLFSPVKPSFARRRNEQLRELAARVRSASAPAIVIGDMNITPFSPYFTDFLRDSGLHDARRRSGFHVTWPTHPVPLWIPIDHCLVVPELLITGVEQGPDVGSDHYPLEVQVSGTKIAEAR